MRRRVLLFGVGGLAMAVAAAASLVAWGDSRGYEPVPLSGPLAEEIDLGSASTVGFPAVEPREAAPPRPPPPPSPSEAVDRFVAAEIEGRFPASFDLLSNADRAKYDSPEVWRRAHHELPRLMGSRRLGDGSVHLPAVEARGVAVATEVALEPRLDRIVGAVPGNAKISWLTVPEDGGWRLAYSDSVIEPRYPDESGAAPAVEAWVERARRCEDRSALEAASGLVGMTGFVQRLCGAPGSVELGAVSGLDTLDDPAVALSAFGPDAADFVRVVELTGPVAMQVLAAPEGDRWLVVGLAAPRTERRPPR